MKLSAGLRLPGILLTVVALMAAGVVIRAEVSTAILLRPDRVFTAEDNSAHPGWEVLIQGERIAAVGPAHTINAPPGAQVINLPEATLLPGLIDLHAHVLLHPYNETLWNDQVLKEPMAYRTIRAVNHVEATLMAGFTTMRDLGSEGAGYADISLRRAIDEQLIPGPRLMVATLAIVATGCYGPGPGGFRPDLDLPKGAQEVSGAGVQPGRTFGAGRHSA